MAQGRSRTYLAKRRHLLITETAVLCIVFTCEGKRFKNKHLVGTVPGNHQAHNKRLLSKWKLLQGIFKVKLLRKGIKHANEPKDEWFIWELYTQTSTS